MADTQKSMIEEGNHKMISSDEWLIRKIKRGDDFAINEFVEKYYPIILNYCKKRVRD